MAGAAFIIALGTRVHTVWILLGGAVLCMIIGSPSPSPPAG
jgi:hypothetical protein